MTQAPAPSALPIRLIVGLGNPGPDYAGNRHNIGFWIMSKLARRHGIGFKATKHAALAEGAIAGRRVGLAKPRTFVNNSGDAVWDLIKRLKIDDAKELLIVYDDIDLPIAKVRMRTKGGHGGNNGLKSIIQATGNSQFSRLRIGIGRPVIDGRPSYDPEDVASYVLSDPPPEERLLLDGAVERAVEAIEIALADGIEDAMRRVN